EMGAGGNSRGPEVRAPPRFQGPACDLRLVVHPNPGAPASTAARPVEGLLRTTLPPPPPGGTSSAKLFATGLQGTQDSNELVTISVDDFKRAFLFKATFPTGKSQPTAEQITR